MRWIDGLPFAGARMLPKMLKLEGSLVVDAVFHDDEANLNSCDLPQTQHQQAVSGASSLSVSVAEFVHPPLKPCLGSKYHVHPNEMRFRLSVSL